MAAALKYPLLSSKNGDINASIITLLFSESSWKIKKSALLNPLGTYELKRGSGNYDGFRSKCRVCAKKSTCSSSSSSVSSVSWAVSSSALIRAKRERIVIENRARASHRVGK